MRNILGCFIFFMLMMTSQIFAGTVYYVDATNGNNSNSGTSLSTAWKTIDKVNNSSFIPGDSILFKKGEQWREVLEPPSSGTSGNRITFGSYGSGDEPIINGADLVNSWTYDGSNVWYAILTTETEQVFFDGVRGNKQAIKANVDSRYDWYWSSNVLYVYSTFNPDTAYTNPGIEASVRAFNIHMIQDNYLDITNLSLKYSNKMGVNLQGAAYINIYDNDISYAAKRGIYFLGDANHIKIYRNNISYCGVEMPTPEHGIYVGVMRELNVIVAMMLRFIEIICTTITKKVNILEI